MREEWRDTDERLDKRGQGIHRNDAREVNGAICYVAESDLAGVQIPLIPTLGWRCGWVVKAIVLKSIEFLARVRIPSTPVKAQKLVAKLGASAAAKLLNKLGIPPMLNIDHINDKKKEELETALTKKPESEVAKNIKRLISIGSYRGSRLNKGYPARGQRTRSNASTAKKQQFRGA